MSYNDDLQNNNSDLQEILDAFCMALVAANKR